MLAQYEKGIFKLCRQSLQGLHDGHRSDGYNATVLPHSQVLVEAIGHRMAYESAREAGIESDLLALYEASVLLHAPAWYVSGMGLDIEAQFKNEAQAMSSILPRLNRLLDGTGAGPYSSAAIVTDESWDRFVASLPEYGTEHEDPVASSCEPLVRARL